MCSLILYAKVLYDFKRNFCFALIFYSLCVIDYAFFGKSIYFLKILGPRKERF